MQVDASKLGLAGGVLWGVLIFGATLVSVPTGYAAEFLKMMGSVYPGYHVSLVGSVVGLVYGFLDGFVGLYLLAWLYTRLLGERGKPPDRLAIERIGRKGGTACTAS